MNTKTIYRITLTEFSNSLCETLAIQAAKSNGSDNKISLEQLKMIADSEALLYPTTNADTLCEIIGGDTLHLDRKVVEDYQTGLILELVEVVELATYENVVSQRNGYGALAE